MAARDGLTLGFVSHSAAGGGAERALVNLLRHLPRGGVRAVALFPAAVGPTRTLAEDIAGVGVFELPYSMSIPLRGRPFAAQKTERETRAFEALYQELELDGVVVNTSAIYPAAVAAALAGLPLVVHCHGVINEALLPELDAEAWRRIQAVQVQLADRIVVPSAWVAEHYRAFFAAAEGQVRVLPNGTHLPPMEACGDGPGPLPAQFSMLCTLEANKGVDVFAEAAARVQAQRPGAARFLVYGDAAPAYRAELENLLRRLGLGERFQLRPRQEEVAAIYRGSRAVIVASRIESFSCVAIEAMSHARVVIATRCGGPEEIIADGETGFLIEAGDSRELAACMLRLIDDAALCRRVGRAARAAAEARFDIRRIAADYWNTVLEAIEEPRAKEWARRRRALAALLGEGLETGRTGAPAAGAGEAWRWPSHADLHEELEALRARLHEINADMKLLD